MGRWLGGAIAAVILLAGAQPARASSVPKVDFKPWEREAQLGTLMPYTAHHQFGEDFAIGDRVSLGVQVQWRMAPPLPFAYPPVLFEDRLRATVRLDDGQSDVRWGLTVATGFVGTGGVGQTLDGPYAYFVQPALVYALRFGPFTLRGTFGPMLSEVPFLDKHYGPLANFWPTVEGAWRLDPLTEVTLGGDALVGMRRNF